MPRGSPGKSSGARESSNGPSALGNDPSRLGGFSLGLGFGGGGSSSNGPDHLIVARCKDEYQREQMRAQTQYYERAALTARFEKDVPASFARREVRRRVLDLKRADSEQLEKRRERLRALYDSDSAQWRAELLEMEPSPESRVDKMRARVAELKAKREAERMKIVTQKLDQQRKTNSDDLRARRSREMVYQVTAARGAQVEEKRQARAREQDQRAADDAAWEDQRKIRAAREDAELSRRRAADADRMHQLEAQIAVLAATRATEAELAQHEAAVARAAHEVALVREAHETRKRKAAEQALRAELDAVNTARSQFQVEVARAALEEDLQWLAALERADNVDRAAAADKKAALRNELTEFRDHVQAQRAAIDARNKDLERAHRAEEDRQWRMRVARWAAEQKAREKLMEDVIRSREEQLDARRQAIRNEMDTKRAEREALERLLEEERKQLQERRVRLLRVQRRYQDDIKVQMRDNKDRALRQSQEEWKEFEAQRHSEREYEEWLERELSRPLAMI